MAYAKVEETFWHDPTVRALSREARTFFLYLLTSPHRNRIGCFVLDTWYAAGDLQWDQAEVQAALEELVEAERVAWDPPSRVVFVQRFLQYNTLENQKVVKAAVGDLRALPDNPFLSNLLAALEENGRAHYSLLLEALRNRIANRTGNDSATVSDTVGDTRAFLRSRSQSRNQDQNQNPPAADAAVPPSPDDDSGGGEEEPPPDDVPPDVEALFPDQPGAAKALVTLTSGRTRGPVANLEMSFLYDEEVRAMPDPSVKGRPLDERRQLVARALVEMLGAGTQRFNALSLAGFIRKLTQNGHGGAHWSEKLDG